MSYQLVNAKVWDGSAWVEAVGGSSLSLLELVERVGSTNVSASASANTKGAWTEMIASADADANWIWLFANSQISGQNGACLLDIGVGAAGAEQVIVSDVAIGWMGNTPPRPIALPVAVASGARVAVRIQHFTGGTTVGVALSLFDGGTEAPASLDTIGADTTNSRGTNLPTSNTYVQITASTSQDYRALIAVPCGGFTLSTVSAVSETTTYTVASGSAGAESVLFTFLVEGTAQESVGLPVGSWVPIYGGTIPAGTRLAVRQSVGRNYRDVVLYGVPA